MLGDVLGGLSLLIGTLLLIMGATGSYGIVSQFGIKLPGGQDIITADQTKTGGPPV